MTAVDESKVARARARRVHGLSREAWTNLLLVGGFYFFAKLIRYAVWSWAAYFLAEELRAVARATRNVYSTAFDVVGLPGVFLTGWLSDQYFGSRRAGVALIMMLGMMTARPALLMVFGDTSVGVFTILLGGGRVHAVRPRRAAHRRRRDGHRRPPARRRSRPA